MTFSRSIVDRRKASGKVTFSTWARVKGPVEWLASRNICGAKRQGRQGSWGSLF
jgi:hypothetical protein